MVKYGAGGKHFCEFGLSKRLVCHFRAVLGGVSNLVVSNGELGNWQVTLVCDMTSPLATLGSIHAGV